MSKTLEGMVRASMDADGWKFDSEPGWIQHGHIQRQRMALLWLADNVSDEMVHAYVLAPNISGKNVGENVRKSISAALRAAGDGK